MHFGFFRWGMNPLRREPMLEQMNREVLTRLRIDPAAPASLLDLGCGIGATLRSFARQLPRATLTGVTRVPWQIDRAAERNATSPETARIHLVRGDYQQTSLPSAAFDGIHALESSCHARGAGKTSLLAEAYRLLRPGGRLVIADGFMRSGAPLGSLQQSIYRKLCDCWVIETLGELDLVTRRDAPSRLLRHHRRAPPVPRRAVRLPHPLGHRPLSCQRRALRRSHHDTRPLEQHPRPHPPSLRRHARRPHDLLHDQRHQDLNPSAP